MNTLRTEDGGWKMADGWKMALLVCFYLLSPIFYLQTETARAAANTNLLGAVFNRTNGMFVAPTNAQFATLTVGAMTVTNFTSFSNNHAVVNGVFFTNLFAAKSYAVAGDTIRVMPGLYRTNNLLKAGVNWFFYPGADIHYTNSGSGTAWGIFDDRPTGSITCNIAGAGRFHYSGGMWGWSNNIPTRVGLGATITPTNYLTERGVLVATNSGTEITMSATEMSMSRFGDLNDLSATVFISNCRKVDLNVNRIHDPNFEVEWQYGEDEFGAVFTKSKSQGIYWERGETYIHCGELNKFGSYGVWISDGPADTNIFNFWYTGDLIQSGIYVDQFTQISRTWWYVKDIEVEPNTGGGSCIGLYGSGRHYFLCQKIGARDTRGAFLTSTGNRMEAWLNAQKVSSQTTWIEIATNTTVHATVQQYEDTGAVTFGLLNLGGTITVHGGEMVVTNGIGVRHEGGITRLNGVSINTSATSSTNSPVFVAGSATTAASPSGLSLRNAWLTAPAEGYPVNATNAQSVRTIGSAANTNSSANVTFTVGTMTVHGTVQ